MLSEIAILLFWATISAIAGIAPTIDYSHNMRVLKLPKTTEVGSIIYRLKGSDPDPDILTFGVRGKYGRQFLEIRPAGFTEADVILKKSLTEKQYKVVIFVTDGVQTTEVESTIIVTEPSSIPSPFLDYSRLMTVKEDSPKNTSVGFLVAKERESSSLPVTFELRGSDSFSIRYIFGPRGASKAEIVLTRTVDYEGKNLYQLQIIALNVWTNESVDTRNAATLDMVVVVEDVPDTPPSFTNLPNVVKIAETVLPGDPVMTVTALDGDYGAARNIIYSIVEGSPWASYFSINETTGVVTLQKPADELRSQYGTANPYILQLKATEVTNGEDGDAMDATAEVAIVLVNTENHPPLFNSRRYLGTVEENSPTLTAVKWEGATVPKVMDRDEGKNGTFQLYLQNHGGVFEVHPANGVHEVEFTILVRRAENMDYEEADPPYFDFVVVAKETQSILMLSATAEVRVRILDINDNTPQFSKDRFEITFQEGIEPGAVVGKIEATDKDSGDYGKVRYTAINGPIARNLHLDPDTGTVTLVSSDGLDRERNPEYTMTVEVRDDQGRGNKNVTELVVHLSDANDNAPIFQHSRYNAVLKPDMATFAERILVKATDADDTGPNSNVTYEIVSGNYQGKFAIDPLTGELWLREPLVAVAPRQDRMMARQLAEIGGFPFPITLTIRAHDQGVPVLFDTAHVQVHTEGYLNRSINFLLNLPIDVMQERKDKVMRGLSSLTGTEVNLLTMRPYNDSQDMTVVQTWAACPLTTTVDLGRLQALLSDIYGDDYMMSSTSAVEVVQKEKYNTVFWILMGLIILLFLLLVVGLLYCCCCRNTAGNEKKLLEGNNKVTPVKHVVTIREDPTYENKGERLNGPKPRAWSDGGVHRIWKFSQRPVTSPPAAGEESSRDAAMSYTHAAGNIASVSNGMNVQHPSSRDHEGNMYFTSGRPISPDTEALLSQLPRDGHNAREVGRYLVVRKEMDHDANRRRRRPEEYQEDYQDPGRDPPRRTEILYIRSPLREAEDAARHDPQEWSRRPASHDYSYGRTEAGPTHQNLKFSRYHRRGSEIYIDEGTDYGRAYPIGDTRSMPYIPPSVPREYYGDIHRRRPQRTGWEDETRYGRREFSNEGIAELPTPAPSPYPSGDAPDEYGSPMKEAEMHQSHVRQLDNSRHKDSGYLLQSVNATEATEPKHQIPDSDQVLDPDESTAVEEMSQMHEPTGVVSDTEDHQKNGTQRSTTEEANRTAIPKGDSKAKARSDGDNDSVSDDTKWKRHKTHSSQSNHQGKEQNWQDSSNTRRTSSDSALEAMDPTPHPDAPTSHPQIRDDDTDSGIGRETGNLPTKKNIYLEKKSVFTIAYDGVQTRKLRSDDGRPLTP